MIDIQCLPMSIRISCMKSHSFSHSGYNYAAQAIKVFSTSFVHLVQFANDFQYTSENSVYNSMVGLKTLNVSPKFRWHSNFVCFLPHASTQNVCLAPPKSTTTIPKDTNMSARKFQSETINVAVSYAYDTPKNLSGTKFRRHKCN